MERGTRTRRTKWIVDGAGKRFFFLANTFDGRCHTFQWEKEKKILTNVLIDFLIGSSKGESRRDPKEEG